MEDITERKLAEVKIKAALLEKEVLMREINHRAKNNLQVVSSLIKMQSRDAGESRFAKLAQDLGNRIAAMTLVHDQILQSKDLNQIDTGRYIISLARNILSSYGENRGRIVLNADTGGIFLDVDTSIHCGLIINELVSNSMKYAFAPEQRGVIGITLRHGLEDGYLELVVHDNGEGMSEGIDILKAKSLGMRLVTALVEDQLRGKIELNRNGGTEFKIVFPAVKQ
jgi:two-component sensor histidine kinase